MLHPTPRSRRYRRLSASSAPGPDHVQDLPSRHRAKGLDAIRCVTLIVLIVITLVLYISLWELERSSIEFGPLTTATSTDIYNLTGRPDKGIPRQTPVVDGATNTIRIADVVPASVTGAVSVRVNQMSQIRYSQDTIHSSKNATVHSWSPWTTFVAEAKPADHGGSQNAVTSHPTKAVALTKELISNNASADTPNTPSCPGAAQCRFLVPVRIAEQESKARQHLVQLAVLARALNRTLVLPNVGRSRLSACGTWAFGTYYDLEEFSAQSTVSSVLALDEFAAWMEDAKGGVAGRIVVLKESVRQKGEDGDGGVFAMSVTQEMEPKFLSCLETALPRLQVTNTPTLTISLRHGFLKHANRYAYLVQFLKGSGASPSEITGSDSDTEDPMIGDPPVASRSNEAKLGHVPILVVDYALRRALFTDPAIEVPHLHYAPLLHDTANHLLERAGSDVLGVHWRMEGVPAQNLAWCAAALVSTLRELLELEDARGNVLGVVWLATDYPQALVEERRREQMEWEDVNGEGTPEDVYKHGMLRKSSTFKEASSEHEEALRTVRQAFKPGGELENYRLTDIIEQVWGSEGRLPIDAALLDDPGVTGILDKLVVTQSSVFVSGSQECSKTR